MKLKRIDIQGFKSFPGKTTIEFCDGITSVVGPNGSGKSNILEAIRWVMGEQRTKILRCKKMEDVIFNGSDSLKPVGMAEVRLTLKNDGKSFPPPLSDYNEIMVTRRLFRDGDSQYELNGIQCRLTDIMEFFLDTGVGKNSYAIIQQGRVELIIGAKPEERRVFLEEAAGVNKYKARRESTIKKLDQTNQNLQRIKDVIAEVSKQNQSLKRQASKAERYRDLKNRLKSMEIAHEAFKVRNLMLGSKETQYTEKELKKELIEKESRLATLSAKAESVRLEIAETQTAFNVSMQNLRSAETELTVAKSRIEICSAQEKQLAERNVKISEELDAVLIKKADAEEKNRDMLAKLDEFDSVESSSAQKIGISEVLISRLEKQSKEQAVALEQHKEAIFGILQDLAQQKNLVDQNLKRKTELQTRLNKDQEGQRLQTSLLEELSKQMESAQGRNIELRKSLDSFESESITDNEKRSGLLARIGILRDNSRKIEKDLLSVRAKTDSMSEQSLNYESYGAGAQYLMKALSLDHYKKLPKPLAEIIDCSPEYLQAVTSALQNQLGSIIVEDFTTAFNIAERMKKLQTGRVTLLSLESFSADGSTEIPENDGGPLRLSDCVTGHEGFGGLIRELTHDFLVVEDMNQALELALNAEVPTALVTLSGEVISNRRSVSVGIPETPEKDVLFRKSELEALVIRSSSLEKELMESTAELREVEDEIKNLSTTIEDRKHLEAELKIEQARLLKDIERLNSDTIRGHSRVREIELNRNTMLEEINNLAKEEIMLQERIKVLDEKRILQDKHKTSFKDDIEKTRSLLSNEARRLNDSRIKLAQMEERKKSHERDLNRTRGFVRNCEHEILGLNQEAESLAKKLHTISEEKIELLDREKALSDHLCHLQAAQGALQTSFNTLKPLVENMSQEELSLSKAIEQLRDAVHHNQVELVRIEENLRNSVEKIQEKYGVNVRLAKCPGVQPEEEEIEATKSKILSVGEVNLAAITESQQVEERLNFLVTQEKDLKGAVKSLFSTIEKIDTTTKQRFQMTFQEVDARFREIFASLFNGGEAWLELTGSEDSLDQGVNILVKPPGKRLQHVELLSGGEKALTAIAFIFAIFLYKPSSFCLLDEVDAPLDDSNVERFNQMLRDLSRNTQFLVITHNKKSMEEADCLFGVTSEETGASTLVSVRLDKL